MSPTNWPALNCVALRVQLLRALHWFRGSQRLESHWSELNFSGTYTRRLLKWSIKCEDHFFISPGRLIIFFYLRLFFNRSVRTASIPAFASIIENVTDKTVRKALHCKNVFKIRVLIWSKVSPWAVRNETWNKSTHQRDWNPYDCVVELRKWPPINHDFILVEINLTSLLILQSKFCH